MEHFLGRQLLQSPQKISHQVMFQKTTLQNEVNLLAGIKKTKPPGTVSR